MLVSVPILSVHVRRMLDRLEYKAAFCFFSLVCCASFVEECVQYWHFDAHALSSAALAWIGNYSANTISLLPICIFFSFPFLLDLHIATRSNPT